MPLNVGSRLGNYDVTALIGEGGTGAFAPRISPLHVPLARPFRCSVGNRHPAKGPSRTDSPLRMTRIVSPSVMPTTSPEKISPTWTVSAGGLGGETTQGPADSNWHGKLHPSSPRRCLRSSFSPTRCFDQGHQKHWGF